MVETNFCGRRDVGELRTRRCGRGASFPLGPKTDAEQASPIYGPLTAISHPAGWPAQLFKNFAQFVFHFFVVAERLQLPFGVRGPSGPPV